MNKDAFRSGKVHLILASASPRRRELMEKLGVPFTCEVSDAREDIPSSVSVHEAAEYLAQLKAEAVSARHTGEPAIVIGSDTVVVCDGKIFGKPADNAEAHAMLRSLSGRYHDVITGVCIKSAAKTVHFSSVTRVKFYELSDAEIDEYISTGEPADKAGAYGIQGLGALLVEKIDGDYYTVVGLPVAETARKLNEMI